MTSPPLSEDDVLRRLMKMPPKPHALVKGAQRKRKPDQTQATDAKRKKTGKSA
jgi:hypothetical protein